MSPQELETKETVCHGCKRERLCTWLKFMHVPLYAWLCEECRDEWTNEEAG